MMIAIAMGALALGTYLWQLSVPMFLQLYDSGVYLAGAIHLVSGIVPYRDFSFVQPPGILVLLSPIAILSRWWGTHDGFILARVLTAVVTATNVGLLSWLVRGRGRGAMIMAGAGLALTPVAVFFSSAIRLEPFCFAFVLLGSIKIVSGADRGALSTNVVVRGGILFGLAGAVEFWAFFPFVAMALCLLVKERERAVAFVAAAGLTLAGTLLPFMLLAPKYFISQVFLEQLGHPRAGGGLLRRLVDITGFSGTPAAPTGCEALLALAAFALVVGAAFRRRTPGEFGDVYLLFAAAIAVGGLLVAPAAYTDYGYFAAPFLAGLLAVTAARLVALVQRWPAGQISLATRRAVVALVGLAAAVLVVGMVAFDMTFYSLYLPLTGVPAKAISDIARSIPRNSCVVYDTVGMGLLANRFHTTDPACPTIVDPFATSMRWGYQSAVPVPQYVAQWRRFLGAAQYLVVAVPIVDTPTALRELPYQGMIAWDRPLQRWFQAHYRLVSCNPECVYENVAKSTSASTR